MLRLARSVAARMQMPIGSSPTAEQVIDVAATEGSAAAHLPIHAAANFGCELEAVGFLLDPLHGAQLEIERAGA